MNAANVLHNITLWYASMLIYMVFHCPTSIISHILLQEWEKKLPAPTTGIQAPMRPFSSGKRHHFNASYCIIARNNNIDQYLAQWEKLQYELLPPHSMPHKCTCRCLLETLPVWKGCTGCLCSQSESLQTLESPCHFAARAPLEQDVLNTTSPHSDMSKVTACHPVI